MARPASKHLTDVELRIMKILWRLEEGSVEELEVGLKEVGHPLAQPSIRTMLNILQKKNMVDRRQEGRKHLYRPAVPEEEATGSFVEDMVDRVFEGSASDLVAALLRSKDLNRDDVSKVRSLLDEFEEDR